MEKRKLCECLGFFFLTDNYYQRKIACKCSLFPSILYRKKKQECKDENVSLETLRKEN